MLAQYADLFRVEAIEAPHRFDARRKIVFSHVMSSFEAEQVIG
jgi:hypothetical protein